MTNLSASFLVISSRWNVPATAMSVGIRLTRATYWTLCAALYLLCCHSLTSSLTFTWQRCLRSSGISLTCVSLNVSLKFDLCLYKAALCDDEHTQQADAHFKSLNSNSTCKTVQSSVSSCEFGPTLWRKCHRVTLSDVTNSHRSKYVLT